MKRNKTLTATLLLFCMIADSGCSKDKDSGGDPVNKDANQYAIALVAGTGNAQTTYIQGLAGFDTISLGNNNATELTGNGRMLVYNGAAYASVYNSPPP
ncbi:hypothetical protein [Paraflavitalea speifideaquila]|uniref:hypothetical protein n=1 Tax=Paraflavitalea speifideaquila TaxID=3076558 RepID=UPI0028E8E3AC|nr:hypothetical protein [Paraflavitalea speifideiaquila]